MVKKIGLAGKSGSGKNVIADLMCAKYGYTQIAVADAIRDEVSNFLHDCFASVESWRFRLPDTIGKMECPKSFDLVSEAFMNAVWAKPTPSEIRVLLQWWGTELRRSQDSEYWIKKLSDRLNNDNYIVVSDVRLPDEIQTIRDHGGEIWYVERAGVPNVGIAGHATEYGLVNAYFDQVVNNNGTLDDLEETVDKMLKFCYRL